MNQKTTTTTITPTALKEALDREDAPLVLDVLPPDVYSRRHIAGAKNACIYEVAFADQVSGFVPVAGRLLVVYGSGGGLQAAPAAAARLRDLGYAAQELEGGIQGWRDAGFPIEGTAPDADETACPPVRLADGSYEVDLETSTVEWTGRNPNGSHTGTIHFRSGKIHVKDDAISGELVVDMTTITCTDLESKLAKALVSHLSTADFFLTNRFETGQLKIKKAESRAETSPTTPSFDVSATITIRDKTRDVAFPATVTPLADGGITALVTLDLDRTLFGSIYGSARFFEHLGMHLVYDIVHLQIRLVATP